jgi:hypothetical protein
MSRLIKQLSTFFAIALLLTSIVVIAGGTDGNGRRFASAQTPSVNHPPSPDPKVVTTNENTPIEITLTGTDPDPGDTITFTILDRPLDGTISVGSSPNSVKYTPIAGYVGPDAFTYTATDNHGFSRTKALVSITVIGSTTNPPPPTANAGPDQIVNESLPVTLDGRGSTDPRSSTLTYSWKQTAGPVVTLSSTTSAIATFTAPTLSSNTAVLAFELTVRNAAGLTGSATIHITVNHVTQPPCQKLPISNVAAIGDDGTNHPANAIDNNFNTRWSNSGLGSWIQADLGGGQMANICSVDITWYNGNQRQNNFAISVSNDGSTFTNPVFTGKSSGATTLSSPERYILPANTVGRFVRITVNGNTQNNWASITEIAVNGFADNTLPPPPPPPHSNGIIHGAMTDAAGHEDGNANLVNAFNNLAGKKIGVAFFSDNWFDGIHFPLDKCISIRTTGAVPFIRIQNWVREGDKLSDAGPYTHKNIIAGMFDSELRAYAQAAKSFGTTLIIEYGVEVNGNWFPWSQEGPDPYKAAYRHIVNLFKEQGVTNVRWAFHVDATDNNNGYKWYPGDDIIDWIGTSCYGAESKKGCIRTLQNIYDSFASISTTKPLGIFEWGIGDATDTANTLHALATDPRYSRIKLLQVWNEGVVPGHPEDKVPDGRINVTPQNLQAYRQGIANQAYVSTYHD